MDPNEIDAVVDRYIERVLLHFTPRQIILFGSHAKGTAGAESDIDIAIVVDDIEGDYLDGLQWLYRLRRDLDDRIEPLLLVGRNDPSGFLAEVRRTGRILYKAA